MMTIRCNDAESTETTLDRLRVLHLGLRSSAGFVLPAFIHENKASLYMGGDLWMIVTL